MAMDLPPNVPTPPALHAPAPECRYLTNSEAQEAFARLKQRLPSTNFANARPSEVCGMVRVQLGRGTVVYTDASGRYLLLAFALDTHRGEPADTSQQLEEAIVARESPLGEPTFGPLMSTPVAK